MPVPGRCQKGKLVTTSGVEKPTEGTLLSVVGTPKPLYCNSHWSTLARMELLSKYGSKQTRPQKLNLESQAPCLADDKSFQSTQLLELQVHTRTATTTPTSSKCTNASVVRLARYPERRKHGALACTEKFTVKRTIWSHSSGQLN